MHGLCECADLFSEAHGTVRMKRDARRLDFCLWSPALAHKLDRRQQIVLNFVSRQMVLNNFLLHGGREWRSSYHVQQFLGQRRVSQPNHARIDLPGCETF